MTAALAVTRTGSRSAQRSYRASVHVKRVRLSRGASPPGRRPRRTSSVGGRALACATASRVGPEPFLTPARRRVRRRAGRPRQRLRSRRPRPGSTSTGSVSMPVTSCSTSDAFASSRLASRRPLPASAVVPRSRSGAPVRPRSRRRSPRPSSRGRLHRTARAPDGRGLASTRASRVTSTPTSHGACSSTAPTSPSVHPRRDPPGMHRRERRSTFCSEASRTTSSPGASETNAAPRAAIPSDASAARRSRTRRVASPSAAGSRTSSARMTSRGGRRASGAGQREERLEIAASERHDEDRALRGWAPRGGGATRGRAPRLPRGRATGSCCRIARSSSWRAGSGRCRAPRPACAAPAGRPRAPRPAGPSGTARA